MTGTKRRVFKQIELSSIDRPKLGSRLDISEEGIVELANNISNRGLIHPILLVERSGRYEIVAGDRRFLAVKLLKKKTILAEVQELSEKEVRLQRATENMHRKDLSPLEEAMAYSEMMEQCDMTVQDISNETGRSLGVIKRRIDILRMPESFQKALHGKRIAVSTAEELWSCPDAAHREYLVEMAVEHGVTKDVARMWVQDYKKGLRKQDGAGGGGSLERGAMEPDPIYRACDICKDPVDYVKVKELRLCPGCFEQILRIVRGGE